MTIERPKPYIGISGIARHEQHAALFDIALRERIDALGYFMMIGIQATGKTQVLEVQTKRGQGWHPVGDTISDAGLNDDSGLTKPFVHCFFSDDEMDRGIVNVMRRTRCYIQGVQFNGLNWINRDYSGLLASFYEAYPGQSIILQANGGVLESGSPSELADRLSTIPTDYLLLDPSGGYGREMDADVIRTYVDEIYQRQIPVGVAVAGGLDSRNIGEIFGPLAERYPSLSCDVEGRLRKGPEDATELDLQLAEDFVLAWAQVVAA